MSHWTPAFDSSFPVISFTIEWSVHTWWRRQMLQKKGKKKGPAIDETPSVVFQHTGFHPHDLLLSPFGTHQQKKILINCTLGECVCICICQYTYIYMYEYIQMTWWKVSNQHGTCERTNCVIHSKCTQYGIYHACTMSACSHIFFQPTHELSLTHTRMKEVITSAQCHPQITHPPPSLLFCQECK